MSDLPDQEQADLKQVERLTREADLQIAAAQRTVRRLRQATENYNQRMHNRSVAD